MGLKFFPLRNPPISTTAPRAPASGAASEAPPCQDTVRSGPLVPLAALLSPHSASGRHHDFGTSAFHGAQTDEVLEMPTALRERNACNAIESTLWLMNGLAGDLVERYQRLARPVTPLDGASFKRSLAQLLAHCESTMAGMAANILAEELSEPPSADMQRSIAFASAGLWDGLRETRIGLVDALSAAAQRAPVDAAQRAAICQTWAERRMLDLQKEAGAAPRGVQRPGTAEQRHLVSASVLLARLQHKFG